MAQAGLIERRPDERDRRAWRLHLIPKGRAARAVAVTHTARLTARLREGFTDQELEVVARWLSAIKDKFPRERSA